MKQKLKLLGEEASDLKQGKKHYPPEIEEARYYIRSELQKRAGKFVHVQILADLLEVEDETWHAAVEGCLGNHKTALMVEPEYAGEAIEIYGSMDKKKFCRAAVVDTKKLMENEHPVQKNSLAEEVKAKEEYAQAYINFLLGNIIKCKSINELRNYKISVTPDCILYKGYRVQHINPENYTRRAYIGENSLRRRRKQLEERKEQLEKRRLPLEEDMEDICDVMRVCTERCFSMSRFITRFADVVKIPEPALVTGKLNELASMCKRFMEGMCNDRNILLWLECDPKLEPVRFDAALLEQVLVNIIKNAAESIEHAPEGTIQQGRVVVRTIAPTTIEVVDNGPGITKETEAKLFSPFFSTKPNGQGIGLVFIREVLTRHGCTFSLRTYSDGLTRFRIIFP